MNFDVFKGSGSIDQNMANYRGPSDTGTGLLDPEGYRANPDLARAVNVALTLSLPLLVTGEPGTGKTQLAYRIAAELGLGEVLRFDTKTSSRAGELFYDFDQVRYFASCQMSAVSGQELPDPRDFIRFLPLGIAILHTLPAETIERLVGSISGFTSPRRSVLLIDEIDKAPRDFPNDLLNQFENLEFMIPELDGVKLEADRSLTPIVIITSNSEKQLPEPFLRRCIYHHIEFPKDRKEMEAILGARLSRLKLAGSAYDEAVSFFFRLRNEVHLAKKPSISELLDWLRILAAVNFDRSGDAGKHRDIMAWCLGSLVKTQEDIERAKRLLDS